jgi:hypothetical protein
MHLGGIWSPGLQLLGSSVQLFATAAPWILSLGLIAAVGRAFQVGPGRTWPKPAYVAFEVAVELVRLTIILVVIGQGDPLAGAHRIGAFFSGTGHSEALGRLAQGWGQHWAEALLALVLFVIAAGAANVVTFTIAGLGPVRGLAAALGIAKAGDKASKLAVVLFLKNLTIIPFTMIWLWELLLFLAH